MASRTAPFHVLQGLKAIDSELGVAWDSEFEGWRFTYEGVPQTFILHHDDGVVIENLDYHETRRLAYRSRADLEAWQRAAAIRRRERVYRNQLKHDKLMEEAKDEAVKVAERRYHPKVYSIPG